VQVRQCKTEAGERSDRLELFTLDRDDEAGEGAALLLAETDSLLEGAGRQLQDGRRLLAETETVGAAVLGDLAGQRETIQRARGRLKGVEAGLGAGGAVLGRMALQARQNKAVMLAVGVAVLLVLLLGLYKLFGG
jgi:vesicle transport through interaction with t-SNAREs protein 1